MRLRLTSHRKGSCVVHAAFAKIKKKYSKRNTLHVYIYEKGFIDNYTLWTKHDELGVPMEGDKGYDDDNNIADWAHLYEAGAFEDEPMDKA